MKTPNTDLKELDKLKEENFKHESQFITGCCMRQDEKPRRKLGHMNSVFNIGRYKWWFLISTIFFIIYILLLIYFQTFGIHEHGNANDPYVMIIIFIGGVFGEIINKSKDLFYSIKAWIFVGLYQGILFFLIYWIVYSIIINKSITNSGPWSGVYANFYYMIFTTIGITTYIFLPSNLLGGLIVFSARYINYNERWKYNRN